MIAQFFLKVTNTTYTIEITHREIHGHSSNNNNEILLESTIVQLTAKSMCPTIRKQSDEKFIYKLK